MTGKKTKTMSDNCGCWLLLFTYKWSCHNGFAGEAGRHRREERGLLDPMDRGMESSVRNADDVQVAKQLFFVSIDSIVYNSSIVNPTHLIEHHLHRLADVRFHNKEVMEHTYSRGVADLLLLPA